VYRTKYVGSSGICYEMPFNLYPLNFTNRLKVVFSEHSLPYSYLIGPNRPSIRIDFRNAMSANLFTSKSAQKANFGRESGFYVELKKDRILPELNSSELRCNELTLDQCREVCSIRFIQNQCKCTPTSWPSLLNHIGNVCSYLLPDSLFIA